MWETRNELRRSIRKGNFVRIFIGGCGYFENVVKGDCHEYWWRDVNSRGNFYPSLLLPPLSSIKGEDVSVSCLRTRPEWIIPFPGANPGSRDAPGITYARKKQRVHFREEGVYLRLRYVSLLSFLFFHTIYIYISCVKGVESFRKLRAGIFIILQKRGED